MSKKKPGISGVVLGVIFLGCLFAEVIMTKDPSYMDLADYSRAPCREFLLGTDTMGRDVFSMIWYGGRISLSVGILASAVSAVIGIGIGTVSALAPVWLDRLMMRFTEIFLSIPNLLLMILLQAILGRATVITIALVIGVTGWTTIAKVVRTEVRQIRNSEYVLASRCMGGGFFHILFRHFVPNFLPSILFIMVMNVRSAIVAESTLSFLGMGLPPEIVSWGSMLSLSEQALFSGAWWMILAPGIIMVVTVFCMTEIGRQLIN